MLVVAVCQAYFDSKFVILDFFSSFFFIRSDDAGTNANHHREWSVSRFHPRKSPAINSCWQTFREETEKKRAWIWGATGRKVEECREFLHVERETWPLFETLCWLEKVIFPFSYFFSFFFLTLFYILSFSYTVKSSLFIRNLCVPVTFVSLMWFLFSSFPFLFFFFFVKKKDTEEERNK